MPPSAATTAAVPDVYYPSSDGRPLGETGWHIVSTATLYAMLREHLARRDAYVAANMFLYYEQGNPRANRSPDCMVALGVVGKHERRSFKTWVEGVVPSVIFEFASKETIDEDVSSKRDIYERLGVAEYFLFDPIGECLDPSFQGFRLEGGRYVALALDADGGLTSRVLGLRLIPESYLLRPIDLQTGRRLLTSEEKSAELAREAESARRERQRAEREQREAEKHRKRAEREKKKAEREHQRADRERQQAERERQRADELAAEVERLRALLGRRDQADGNPATGD
jgi:Uma2 family endonuclease